MEPDSNKGFAYEFGKFVLDPRERTLYSNGASLHLPAKEFDTLVFLVEHNGHAVSKEEMLAAIWRDAFVEESNLTKQISRLRKIFNTNGNQFIETIPKFGYRFRADVNPIVIDNGDALVLERRTVKRMTVDVEDRRTDTVTALPAGRRRFVSAALAALFVVTLGSSVFLVWWYRSSAPVPVDPYAPVRLTDNPDDDTGPVWTRDGRIRFTRFQSGNRPETWIMNFDGTNQTPIAMPAGKRIVSWSPDEKRILFYKDDDREKIFLSDADGSREVLLSFPGGVWSADSTMLLYHQKVSGYNFEIYRYDVETGTSTNITNDPAFDTDPSFSPDGKQLVFSSGRDGNQEIYVANVDGSNVRRITFDPALDTHAAFSPDGTQLLFSSNRENENGDVYLVSVDGGEPVKLTTWDKSNETAGPGGWSPDGTKIVFFSDRNEKDDIYVVSAEVYRAKLLLADSDRDLKTPAYSPDGEEVVYSAENENESGELLLADLDTGRSTHLRDTSLPMVVADWSPDGGRIVFSDRQAGNSEVFILNKDSGDPLNLTNDPAHDSGPAWSPDGKRIVFVSNRGEFPRSVFQLYTMDADGSDPRPVTPRKGWESDPTWTPDGGRIVFACDRGDIRGNMLDICQINADGTNETRLLLHPDHDSRPVVSQDGNLIAFTALSDGNAEIYIMKRDGSRLLRLTRHSATDMWPDWSPDGKKLIFSSNRNGRFALYEIEVPTG